MLSLDVEEYFHAEAVRRGGTGPEQWDHLPRRLEPLLERILALLDEHRARATFFVLGWVGRHEPGAVRRIVEAGHEIASHSMGHMMIGRLSPEQFRADLLESKRLLEDLCGQEVIGYRAPTFSLTQRTCWALDVLAEAGFAYDSSVFPVRHDRYGVPQAPGGVHRAVGPGGGAILEIPPLTVRLLGSNWPVGGGGYLRLLPVRWVGRALRSARRRGQAGMLYLHPWEFDPDQPRLPMGRLSRWRHHVRLDATEEKLRWLLQRFHFTSVRDMLPRLRAAELETFTYGQGVQPAPASDRAGPAGP